LSGDRGYGVGVIAKIGGLEDRLAKIGSAANAPERRFERKRGLGKRIAP